MNTKRRSGMFAILVAVMMVFAMTPIMGGAVYADSDTEQTINGVKYTLTVDDNDNKMVSVTGCDENLTGAVEILDAVTFGEVKYPVTSIGRDAFGWKTITSVTIPACVTSIGEGAFYYCKSLGTVTFAAGSKLTSIGGSAFQRTAITSITIPAEVTSIGESAFQRTAITSITIPAEVASIGESAFQNCESLGTVTFAAGSNLESIGGSAFQRTAITSITIPAEVTSIGGSAFQNCESLGTVTFAAGSNLKSIGGSAFQGTAITSITIPASVTGIEEYAFYCQSLGTVTFAAGSNLESIGESAFQRTAITSITIPAEVTSIGGSAFQNCSSLGTVTFAAGSKLKSIGESAFQDTAITSITIPANVTSIGARAFYCDTLDTVYYVGTQDQWNEMSDRDSYWTGGRDVDVFFVNGAADVPVGKTLIYNGAEQTGVEAGEGYTLTGTVSATDAGSYEATATLADGYVWTDGTTEPKTILWKINKSTAKVAVPAGKSFTYNGKAQTGVAAGNNYTLSGTAKATNAGTYTAKATLKSNANYTYKWSDETTAAKTIKWTINKAANPLSVKAKTATVKGCTKGKNGKLKKTKTLKADNVIRFTNKGQGIKTYIKKSGNKKITIAKKTGKVTVKKGLKKGTYKVKVKVKAAGNANYNASKMKTVTFKLIVK